MLSQTSFTLGLLSAVMVPQSNSLPVSQPPIAFAASSSAQVKVWTGSDSQQIAYWNSAQTPSPSPGCDRRNNPSSCRSS